MRKTPMPRRSRPIARGERIKATNAKRRVKEFARAYGSADRVEWVKGLPCLICKNTTTPPCENAHVGNGGMSRKSDAAEIVPLCWPHHRSLHIRGVATFEAMYRVTLKAEAARIDTEWQAECARRASLTRKER